MDDEEIKDVCLAEGPHWINEHVRREASKLREESIGFITWDAQPQEGVSYQTHKFTFIDALATADVFLKSNFVNSWLIVGGTTYVVISSLPQVVMAARENRGKNNIFYLGDIAHHKIFVDWEYPQHEWGVINQGKFVLGLIRNPPIL